MPRPPKTRHFMRDIREALKDSQTRFADRLGVTASAIKQMENGQMKMSQAFKARLYAETGFGFEGRGVAAPYTKDDWLTWKARAAPATTEEERKTLAESLHQWIEILFSAASESIDEKTPNVLFPVYQRLVELIDQTCLDFRLVGKAEMILAERWPTWRRHGFGITKNKRGFWHPGFIAPQITESIPSWTRSYRTLSDVSDPETSGYPILSEKEAIEAVENIRRQTLKTPPLPPSTGNAGRAKRKYAKSK